MAGDSGGEGGVGRGFVGRLATGRGEMMVGFFLACAEGGRGGGEAQLSEVWRGA